jgi:acyl-CoA thioester hydrolase
MLNAASAVIDMSRILCEWRGSTRSEPRDVRYHLPVTPTPVSEYTLQRRVNFYEVDQAGIVHFSNYYRYMEEAEYGLWRTAGVSLEPTPDYAFPRVAASFEFHAPLRFQDEMSVCLQIAHIGRTSLRYVCRITRGETSIATGAMTLVCVSPADMRPVPLPRNRLERITIGAAPNAT